MTTQSIAAKASAQVAKVNVPVVQHTNTQEQSNSPDLIDLGAKAIKLINEGDMKRGKGIAIMTYVIAQAYYTKSFETTSQGVKSFTLDDIVQGKDVTHDSAGKPLLKKNNKLSAARLNVVARDLFGIEGTKKDEKSKTLDFFNVSQKGTFIKALNMVHNLIMLKVRVSEQVQLDRDNNLMLPLWCFYKPQDKPHFKAQFEKSKYEITPIVSFMDTEKMIDKHLSDMNLKSKRGTSSRTPEQKFMDNLGEVTGKAKAIVLEFETGKLLKIPVDQRRKMQEALIAIQKLFNAEKKAEEKASQEEQKELLAKAKAKA